MQQASTIASRAIAQPSTTSSKPLPPEKLRQGLLDNLWLKMTEMYGHRWTGSFGVTADQSHAWAATLGGLTGQQIAIGLGALAVTQDVQLKKWPPSAPEFRAMCENRTPEAFGLPAEEAAYREACRNAHPCMAGITKWTHEVVYHAATETGFYNLNTLRTPDSRKLFGRNYAIACRMFMDGQPLKSMPLALPETVAGSITPEVGNSALAKLREQLGGRRG